MKVEDSEQLEGLHREFQDGNRSVLSALAAAHRMGAASVEFTAGEREVLLTELRRQIINAPENEDFREGVLIEALHQVERWGPEHDAGKTPEGWFWALGYLGGKLLAAERAGDREKAKHHTISCTALLANWHRHIQSRGVNDT